MKKRPAKVEETRTPYAANKPAVKAAASKPTVPGGKFGDEAAFKKLTGKIFSERKELLRKLAQ